MPTGREHLQPSSLCLQEENIYNPRHYAYRKRTSTTLLITPVGREDLQLLWSDAYRKKTICNPNGPIPIAEIGREYLQPQWSHTYRKRTSAIFMNMQRQEENVRNPHYHTSIGKQFLKPSSSHTDRKWIFAALVIPYLFQISPLQVILACVRASVGIQTPVRLLDNTSFHVFFSFFSLPQPVKLLNNTSFFFFCFCCCCFSFFPFFCRPEVTLCGWHDVKNPITD